MWADSYWGKVPISPKIKKNQMARGLNWQEFMNQFEGYLTLAQSLFKWEGLPPTCDERMLERMLILNGTAVMCELSGTHVILGAAPGFDLNINGYPTKVWGWGYNGFNREFRAYVPGADDSRELVKAASGYTQDGAPNAVICYDNAEAYPFILFIMAAARRVADTMRAADVAVKTMKTPYVIAAEETTARDIASIMDKYEDNVFTILTTKGFSLDSIKVWPTNTDPKLLDAYWQYKCNVSDDLAYQLGLPNNPQADKHERLLVDEVNANNSITGINLSKRLDWRKKFCEQVNDLWGLNISVRINEEVQADDGFGEDDLDGDGQDSSDVGTVQRDVD